MKLPIGNWDMKILHPPLYPLPSREGAITPPRSSPYLRGGWWGYIPSPLVGEGEGEGYFRDKYYALPFLFGFLSKVNQGIEK
jgi:hypothetical protein